MIKKKYSWSHHKVLEKFCKFIDYKMHKIESILPYSDIVLPALKKS